MSKESLRADDVDAKPRLVTKGQDSFPKCPNSRPSLLVYYPFLHTIIQLHTKQKRTKITAWIDTRFNNNLCEYGHEHSFPQNHKIS
jgi:hypothetical protein